VGQLIDTGDVVETQGIAALLCPDQRTTAFPSRSSCLNVARLAITLGRGRSKLTLRTEVEARGADRGNPAPN
jgi:hypothetical protein